MMKSEYLGQRVYEDDNGTYSSRCYESGGQKNKIREVRLSDEEGGFMTDSLRWGGRVLPGRGAGPLPLTPRVGPSRKSRLFAGASGSLPVSPSCGCGIQRVAQHGTRSVSDGGNVGTGHDTHKPAIRKRSAFTTHLATGIHISYLAGVVDGPAGS